MERKISIFELAKLTNTRFLDTNLTITLPEWLLWGLCKNLHDCISALVINGTSLSSAPPFNISCTFPSTSNLSRILVIVTLVDGVCQIQPSNIVELQQLSPLSNKTSESTYVHRMIISPPYLFKHMKDDGRVAMFSQCLLDHTQQKLYFCLISLLRNNVSKSVYVNLRHSV